MAASKGVWFDTATAKVVESQPEQGVQLIAPGVEATPDDDRRVEVYRAAVKAERVETVVTTEGTRARK